MVNKYYQKYKERSTCRKKHVSFTKVEKDKRQKMTRERYQNFTEEEKEKSRQCYQESKQKLPVYRRNYYLRHKK